MTTRCHNCGFEAEDDAKFCRKCGADVQPSEAATWHLPETSPAETVRPTEPVRPGTTEQQTGPPYTPYVGYYQPPQPPVPYQPQYQQPSHVNISLGAWLSDGWKVYKENWLLMSMASLLGAFLSVITIGVMAGPLLMGLYRMAFRTMRGERPDMNDLFNWEGRFLQAFLAALVFMAVYGGLSGAGQNQPVLVLFQVLITPLLTTILAFTLPLILERKIDVAAAVNEVGKLVFTRDFLMWWVIGLVFSTIAGFGILGVCVGLFVTVPWVVSSAAVAYRDIFGFDDPNRTLP